MKAAFLLTWAIVFSHAYGSTTLDSVGPRGLAPVPDCSVRVKFLSTKVARERYVRNGIQGTKDFVWWTVDLINREGKNCPTGHTVNIRIRGAGFFGLNVNPQISYPNGIYTPEQNSIVSLDLTHVQGRDSILNRDYEEWFPIKYNVE